jgi:hypothetical protein
MTDTTFDIDRRSFMKTGAATAASATGLLSLAGCGGSTKREDVQFVLGAGSVAEQYEYTFHVDGEATPLVAHTDQSLVNLASSNPRLLQGPGGVRVSHYAAQVEIPTDRATRTHVTRRLKSSPAGTHEIVLVHIGVPTARLETELGRVREIRDGMGLPGPVQSKALGGFSVANYGQVLSPVDTAVAIVYHHPELMALESDMATTIVAHIHCANGFDELWSTIAANPGTTGDDESWCEMVQVIDKTTGLPYRDDRGNILYDYKVTDAIMALAGVVIKDALTTSKNDETLRQKVWQQQEGTANQSTDAPVTATVVGASRSTVTGSLKGYSGGLFITPSLKSAANRSVEVLITNWFRRYHGVYLTFYDAEGKRLSLTDDEWGNAILGTSASFHPISLYVSAFNLQSAENKLVKHLGPPSSIMGIPTIPGQIKFQVQMPERARRFTVTAGSLGIGAGSNAEQEILGIVLTSVLNFGVPSIMLAWTSGVVADATLYELIDPNLAIQLVSVAADLVSYIGTYTGAKSDDAKSLASRSFVTGIARVISIVAANFISILLHKSMAKIWAWLAIQVGLQNLLGAIPFVGWGLRAASVTATAAALIQTTAECASARSSTSSDVSIALDVALSIHHDLDAQQFPQTAKYYEAAGYIGGTTTYYSGKKPFNLAALQSDGSLSVSFAQLPSGGTGRFNVNFYDESDTLVGKGLAATFKISDAAIQRFKANAKIPVTSAVNPSNVADKLSNALTIRNKAYPSMPALKAALEPLLTVVELDACMRELSDAFAITDIPLLIDSTSGNGILSLESTITELRVELTSATKYRHQRVLDYDGSKYKYAWKETTVAPLPAPAICDNAGQFVCELPSITLARRTGDLGYAWRTSSANLPTCGASAENVQVYAVQNISTGFDPNLNLKTLNMNGSRCGVIEGAGVYYQFDGPSDGSGANFLLDGRGGKIRVRPVNLSTSSAFDLANRNTHYGTFTEMPTSLTWHPEGYLVGVNRVRHKIEILDLNKGLISDDFDYPAQIASGQGTRFGLVLGPSCIASRFDGTLLVLESQARRVQAFDIKGLPVSAFPGGATFALRDYGWQETYLDMSVEALGYVYVLSYISNGSQASQYNLDIYAPDGTWLSNTNGFTAARMIVDYWRNVHTLNWQTIKGPGGRNEPTVSQWIPTTA